MPARSQESPFAQAALDLAARGWSVIPMQPRAKRPLVAWRQFQQHPASAEQIRHWFARQPDANVGIVTGRVSGLVVIDVDVQHGGPASLAALEAEWGLMPPTVEALTGGGGRHLYCRHPGGTVPNRVAIRPGIDVRGDGGCVVAPPSVHPNGRHYAWIAGHAPGELALAPLPLRWFDPETGSRPTSRSRSDWRRLIRAGVAEGERNSTMASLTGHLLARDVDPGAVLELMLAWNRTHCRPPLSDEEVAAVVRNITHLHGGSTPWT